MPAVVASSDAYVKAVLHCYKYPTQAVLGILVGKSINGTSDCYVTDAYPLFHSMAMSAPHPMLEVAYAHCQSAARTAGLTLLGVYLANERLDDRSIAKEVTRPLLEFLMAKLGLTRNGLLVWFIANDTMTSPPNALSTTSFYYEPGLYERAAATASSAASSSSSAAAVPPPSACIKENHPKSPLTSLAFGHWNSDTLAPEATVAVEAVIEATTNALDNFAQYRLVDFEDHLENPEVNYLDQPLQSLITKQ